MNVLILLGLLSLSYGDIEVEVSFLVDAGYNESNFETLLYSELNNTRGNVSLNTSLDIFFPSIRSLYVSPILCVLGSNYHCYNDTNVTRYADINDGNESIEYIMYGVGGFSLVLVVLLFFFLRKKPLEKRILAVVIDWPKKKMVLGHGSYPPNNTINIYGHHSRGF
jgi:hypothetical protein